MFLEFAVKYFRIKYGMEPERTTCIGTYPEENPTHFVYEISTGEGTLNNFISNMVVEITENGLMAREVQDEKEMDAIKQLREGFEEEKVETL